MEQINRAFADMDQVVQTNAGNSQATAEYAHDLLENSKSLNEVVEKVQEMIHG
jgi:methyl-accepting chemotaxis protein